MEIIFRMIDSYLQGELSSGGPGAAILFIPAGVWYTVTANVKWNTWVNYSKKQDRILITQSNLLLITLSFLLWE